MTTIRRLIGRINIAYIINVIHVLVALEYKKNYKRVIIFVVNFDDEDDADGKRTADNDDDSPTNR
jgi:hypothetical protein